MAQLPSCIQLSNNFVTNSIRTKRILNKYLKQYNAADKFRINIMGDFEKGKKWLVSK